MEYLEYKVFVLGILTSYSLMCLCCLVLLGGWLALHCQSRDQGSSVTV